MVNIDVMQFEDILSRPDPNEDLPELVDPRLEDNYPLDSVIKVISHSSRQANYG